MLRINIADVCLAHPIPGITKAVQAFGMTVGELNSRVAEFNPILRIGRLAEAGIPMTLIHGDEDKVVPLEPNSGEVQRIYKAAGKESLLKLIVLKGQGHSFYEEFFHSQELVDFGIEQAIAATK